MSSSRLRNSELAQKLKARANVEDDKTSLLKGKRSSSDEPIDAHVRFPFLAPFMACQMPNREVVSPSTMNYFPARNHLGRKDYPLLNSGETWGGNVNGLMVNSRSSPSLSAQKHRMNPSHAQAAGCTPVSERQPPTPTAQHDSLSFNTCTIDSSLMTCAPSSVIMASSTSATCPSITNFSETTCAPSSKLAGDSTSATCSTAKSDSLSMMPCAPSRMPASTSATPPTVSHHKREKNLLRLIHDLDGKPTSRSDSTKNQWRLSPFAKSRKVKQSVDEKKCNTKKDKPVSRNPVPLQQTRGAPVDIDEVSIDSRDTEAGYYSDPTNIPNTLYRTTDTSMGTGRSVLPQNFDREQVLSQLGMDVQKDEYCIEGEYGHRRAGSGRWNYHPKKSQSFVYDSRLDAAVVTDDAKCGQRRGSKLGENIKESMKKIGSIIKVSDDEESESDGGRKRRHRNTGNDKLGSKVFAMLRGKTNVSTIPQCITITPSSSEDPELTNNDLELMHRWQEARARLRSEGQASPPRHKRDASVARPHIDKSHKRDDSRTFSIAESFVSERTAHVDNRMQSYLDGVGHGADYSF